MALTKGGPDPALRTLFCETSGTGQQAAATGLLLLQHGVSLRVLGGSAMGKGSMRGQIYQGREARVTTRIPYILAAGPHLARTGTVPCFPSGHV